MTHTSPRVPTEALTDEEIAVLEKVEFLLYLMRREPLDVAAEIAKRISQMIEPLLQARITR